MYDYVVSYDMPLPIRVLPLHRGDRARLESLVRSRTTPQRVVERARIVLGSAAGDSGSTICGDVGVSRPTVTLWLDRYEAGGLAALRADPRSGRPKRITLAEEEAIVRRTTQTPPPAGRGTHWSTRLMAEVTGFHHSTIARIWKAHGLRPHRVRPFKLSTDPAFVEKLRDVVGLYLQPPERAIVFSLDEKSQIQALDRTQPGLPLVQGWPTSCRHRPHHSGVHAEASPSGVSQVHPVVRTTAKDRVCTEHPEWLHRHRRVHFHFTPTSASWLNLVERFFSELTERQLRRLAVTSVDELIQAITDYITCRNENPKPFTWTATVRQILKKVHKANETLATLH